MFLFLSDLVLIKINKLVNLGEFLSLVVFYKKKKEKSTKYITQLFNKFEKFEIV